MALLEKLGFYLSKEKLFKMIHVDIWEAYSKLFFEYQEELVDKHKKIKKQEDYIGKLVELKNKGVLSKRRLRELKSKEDLLET